MRAPNSRVDGAGRAAYMPRACRYMLQYESFVAALPTWHGRSVTRAAGF